MKVKSVLITGISGFVGSHLADYILQNHKGVGIAGIVRWRSPLSNIDHVKNKLQLHWGDLEDSHSIQRILLKTKPDVIFHLAAQSYVDFSFLAPISTMNTNVIGTTNLLEEVRKLKSRKFDPVVHVCSSSEVYGQVKKSEIPIREDNPFRPSSPYAVSKLCEDMLGLQYYLSWNIKVIRTRLFTHTGPRRGEVFAESSFAKQIAAIESGIQKPEMFVGNLNSTRTYMDVRDAVRAYWLLVTKCKAGEVYNIGGAETMTVGEVLKKLLKLSKEKNIKVTVDPKRLRPSDVTLQIPSTRKFTKETGWKTTIKFEKTLIDIINYWRQYYKKNV